MIKINVMNAPDNKTDPKVSMLRLTDYINSTEMVSGYYWCTVQSDNRTLSSPSNVVNIDICPFPHIKADEYMDSCLIHVDMFKNVTTNGCVGDSTNLNVGKVQLGVCATEDPVTNPLSTDEPASTDEVFPTLDQPTISPSRMNYVWMIVGIAFGILIVIIVIMLIAIVYLNHKKNKIKGIRAKFRSSYVLFILKGHA